MHFKRIYKVPVAVGSAAGGVDVLIYLVALAARCRVDLPPAVLSKMDTNRRRYPVHLARGSAWKYTDFGQGAGSEDQAAGAAPLACESPGQGPT
uniref:Uncharacterized protein n=1 Tax=Oryctolagus cuniculus TaxID=9986 RepID=A0A5F9D0D7_RABIT